MESDFLRRPVSFIAAVVAGRPRPLSPAATELAAAQKTIWNASRPEVIIVDSSKHLPLLAHHLGDDELEIDIVHVRRRACDAVNSSMRKGTKKRIKNYGILRRHLVMLAEGMRWLAGEIYMSRICYPGANITFLQYEKWSQFPDSTTSDLVRRLGLRLELQDGAFPPSNKHIIWGNRSRRIGQTESKIMPAGTQRECLSGPAIFVLDLFDRLAPAPGSSPLR